MRTDTKCSEPGCPCTVWSGSPDGLCYGHQQKKASEERKAAAKKKDGPGRPRTQDLICSVIGCGRKTKAKGMCQYHYQKSLTLFEF